MSDINLTSTVRDGLFALDRASSARAQSTRRLSTGREVERATDGPAAFFQSQALSNRASGLFGAKDNIGQALSAVEGALDATDALTDIARQLEGVARGARGGSAEDRQAAAEQFDSLRRQLDNLAGDATYQGTGLVRSDSESLTVSLNETGTSRVTVDGRAADASGLGISSAQGAGNGFATDADIDAAVSEVRNAISSLRSGSSGFSADVATLNIREEFSARLGNTLDEGAAKLVNADTNEEAARQLSSQIRQDLSVQSLSVAARGARQISQILFTT